MDASKYVRTLDDSTRFGLGLRPQIVRDLRKLADEIDNGTRLVEGVETNEIAHHEDFPSSVLVIKSRHHHDKPAEKTDAVG